MPAEPPRITNFAGALDRARALAAGSPRALLGICGAPGSGKTTLAAALTAALCDAGGDRFARHVPMDGFHLADVALRRLGRLDRKGAPDTFDAAGYAALLQRLRHPRPGETVYAPQFERELEQPIAGAIPVEADVRLVISEGNYLLVSDGGWEAVAAAFDEVWFLDSDAAARVPRLVRRHVEFGKTEAQARAWVRDVDERNATLISETLSRARVRVSPQTVEGV